MADVNVQNIDIDGLVPAYAACSAGGDHLQVGNGYFAHFKNDSVAPITVTIETPGTVEGLAVADRVLTVDANDSLMVTLGSRSYKNDTDQRAHVTYSDVTTLTVALLVV